MGDILLSLLYFMLINILNFKQINANGEQAIQGFIENGVGVWARDGECGRIFRTFSTRPGAIFYSVVVLQCLSNVYVPIGRCSQNIISLFT